MNTYEIVDIILETECELIAKRQKKKEFFYAVFLGELIVISLILGLLSGCAHTRTAEWQGNQRTICGNKWSNEEDLNLEAQKACHGGAHPVAGFENQELAGYSQGFSGQIRANYRKEKCLVYECGN